MKKEKIEPKLTKQKDMEDKNKRLIKATKQLEKEGFSGIIFNKDIGHIVFLKNETDIHILIELAKLQDEFVQQKRKFTASQMLKSNLDNIQREISKDKSKPNYMG